MMALVGLQATHINIVTQPDRRPRSGILVGR